MLQIGMLEKRMDGETNLDLALQRAASGRPKPAAGREGAGHGASVG
jgi:hypothetical protein